MLEAMCYVLLCILEAVGGRFYIAGRRVIVGGAESAGGARGNS